MGQKTGLLTALQRRRIEAAEMKLSRLLAGYIRRELEITVILDKVDEYRRNWLLTCKECHKTESLWSHTTTDNREEEQLEDRRNVDESCCNSGDGTVQRVQFFIFKTCSVGTDP